MNTQLDLLTFIVLALAVWRISSLFANEGGPLDIFVKFRILAGGCEDGNCAGKNWFAKGLMCEWCNSVWFGTLTTIAYLLFPTFVFWACLPLAFSTIVIMLKYFRERMAK